MKALESSQYYSLQIIETSTKLTEDIHGLACPNCSSRKYVKNGKVKGNQRYKCKCCKTSFRSTTGATIHKLHLKAKLKEYIECMTTGLSLRKTANKIGISLQTAFRWRHRFLSTMVKHQRNKQLNHSIIDSFVLPYSHKGQKGTKACKSMVRNIVQTDIAGNIRITLLEKNQKALSLLTDQLVMIKSKALPRIFKKQSHSGSTAEQREKMQNLQRSISDWLSRFRGVATKYLKHYWSWFELMWQIQNRQSEDQQYMLKCF